MRCPEVAVATVRDAVVAVMDRDDLVALVGQVRLIRAWCDGIEVGAVRRTRELEAAGQAERAEVLLGDGGRRSTREAKTMADRETVCGAMPSFEAALSSGDVSAGHVDAIASATRGLDDVTRAAVVGHEADLLAAAIGQRVDTFERSCRELVRELSAKTSAAGDDERLQEQRRRANVKRWTDRETGMAHTHLELDPLRDSTFWTAVQAQLATLRQQDGNRLTSWQQLQVDAVVAAVSAGEAASRVPEVSVLIDYQTLLSGFHALGLCETETGAPLPVSTVRRLCCDADIIPIVLGAGGEVLDVGRAVRTASRAQRRALRALHRTCAHPACTVPFDACRIHHVRWWWQHRGVTDLANLLPVCENHHHLVHEGRWGLTMSPDRVATWTRPDGVVFHTGSTIDRRPEPIARARSSPVGLAS